MAKLATKMKPPKQPDLFDAPGRRGQSLPARKVAGRKAPKASKPAARAKSRGGSAESRLHRQAYRGAGGARARPPPPRHVYRRHRREGAASLVRRGDRQFHGRGARRPRHLDRGGDGGERLRLGHRQRPRHSGRRASKVQEQVGAGSHHVHAARRRQIRFKGLRDIGRPARRRRLGRQRAVRAHGSRGRARADALPHGFRARQAEGQAGQGRPRAQPARHQNPLPSRSGDFRAQGRVQAPSACSRWRAPRPICSAASRSAGIATRRCSRASRTCRRRRRSISPKV